MPVRTEPFGEIDSKAAIKIFSDFRMKSQQASLQQSSRDWSKRKPTGFAANLPTVLMRTTAFSAPFPFSTLSTNWSSVMLAVISIVRSNWILNMPRHMPTKLGGTIYLLVKEYQRISRATLQQPKCVHNEL